MISIPATKRKNNVVSVLKDQIYSLELTLETISNRQLIKEIQQGIKEIRKGQWTKVRNYVYFTQL